MAKVKLDTMLGGVNSRLGNVVYSEWKGVKYVRKWVKALSGYNLFFKSNFGLLKGGELLELSRGNGIAAPEDLSASISDSGVISVSFRKGDDSAMVSIFVQNMKEQNGRKLITARLDVDTSIMPVRLEGFDPGADYNVYAVAGSSAMDGAEAVSDSTGCSVTR